MLDGVYVADRPQGRPRFVSVSAPSAVKLTQLLERIVTESDLGAQAD